MEPTLNPHDLVFRPGQPLNLDRLNRLAELAGRTDHVSVAGGLGVEVGAGGVRVYDQSPIERFVRITAQSPGVGTGVPPGYFYSWEPVRPKFKNYGTEEDPDYQQPVTGAWWVIDPDEPWEPDDQCNEGTYANFPAVECNKTVGVAVDTVVRAWLGDDGQSLRFLVPPGGGGTVGGTTTTTYGPSTTTTYNGTLVVQGPYYQPHYSFSAWTGDQTDIDLSVAGNVRLRIASDQHFRRINSLIPGANPAGRVIYLHNVGNYVFLITNEDVGTATAARRIRTTTGNDYWLAPGHCVALVYDNTTQRWRVSENSDERLGGVKTYDEFDADVDDWEILPQYEQHRVLASVPVRITGIKYGKPGLRHRIVNHCPEVITLTHEDTDSAAANRFSLPGGHDLPLHQHADLMIDWDGESGRWRVVAHRDLFGERQVVYGDVTGGDAARPVSSADFTREAEGVIRQSRDSDSTHPEHQLLRRRAADTDVDTDDVIGRWAGRARVDGVDEVLLGFCQVVYVGDGETVEGCWEAWGVLNGTPNKGVTVHPDGDVEVENANAASELLVTDADGHVKNASYAAVAASLGALAWVKVTLGFADFAAAATSNEIEAHSLPARGVVHAVVLKHTTAFGGGGAGFVTASVGPNGNETIYLNAVPVSNAVADTTFWRNFSPDTTSNELFTFGAATSIRCVLTSDVNLNLLTAGSLDVYLLVSQLPA